MQRFSVIGVSGSGKTTLSRAISERTGAPHLELDSVVHQPNWTELPTPELRRRVAVHVAAEAWVVDGNYSSRVQDLVWGRADTVVWLDLPRRVLMPALLWRTVRRGATGEELWNGNREHLSNLLATNAEENLLIWAWTRQRVVRRRTEHASRSPEWSHLRFVRLRTRGEVREFVRSL